MIFITTLSFDKIIRTLVYKHRC